jgi:hypothetical protein|nr:unnamed protein product [Kluyveromyces lactis]
MEIIEHKVEFKYKSIDEYQWTDNFKLDKQWEILRFKKNKIVQKSYMNRFPYSEPKKDYSIALYSKNKWYCLKDGVGSYISIQKEKPQIKDLTITEIKYEPYLVIYKLDFEYHIMMTILHCDERVKLLEYKRPFLKEGIILFNEMKIYVYNGLFSYKGNKIEDFELFVNEFNSQYKENYDRLFKIFGKSNHTHKSIDYKTWCKAKRENQQEWPLFTNIKIKDSIEFPNNSGIYYYYPDKYVGLARRNDDNLIPLIPKIYRKNHYENKNSLLYKYVNGLPIDEEENIPYSLKKEKYKFIKYHEDEKIIEVDYNNNVVKQKDMAEYYCYNNKLIQKIEEPVKLPKIEAQILNKRNERVEVLIDNEWKNLAGNRIDGIPTLPWNYKHIIHDYNKLGRLKKGKIMDLTHIGIVNENGTDIITWPYTDDLYIGRSIETKRLITFKYQKNVEIYDKLIDM